MDRVRDLMTAQPLTVAPDSHIVHCAMQMMDFGIRHLPVIDAGKLVGLVDDTAVFGNGALVDGALWVQFDPKGPSQAKQLAAPAVEIDADADLTTALKTMSGHSAAVVMEAGHAVGILSEHDILRAAPAIVPASFLVGSHATAHPRMVTPDTPARVALTEMREHRIRHLVVSENGCALGVISVRDLAGGFTHSDTPVENLLEAEIFSTTAETPIVEAALDMTERQIGCLVVLDANGLALQVFTRTDVLAAVASALEDEALFPGAP